MAKLTKANKVQYEELIKLHHEVIRAKMADDKHRFENAIEKINILTYKEGRVY